MNESTSDCTPSDRDGRPTPPTAPENRSPVQLRCPHCDNPIRLSDARDGEVLCPCCGGPFSVTDARMTDTGSASRPLGKFLLLERVGQGAFGAVWKARDTVLDRIVALKIPHSGLLTENEELERFYREARASAQLRHPGIVTVHEVQMLDGLPVIVADFVRGVTLKELLELRQLTFSEAAELVAQMAEALDYAHTMGLVHRDIKPANVMLERGPLCSGVLGRPLLMDFGLVLRDEAEVTMTLDGHVIGTPAYMSPEQAAGKSHQADRRSDVYSLGVILYELLSGTLPFRGSKQMILYQVLHEEPRSPRLLNNQVPRDLDTICLKCLRKEPAKRYATAAELAADLRRFLGGEPVRARPVGLAERLARWAARRPGVAALTASLVLVSLLGASLVTASWLDAIGQARRAVAEEDRADREAEAGKAAREAADRSAAAEATARRTATEQTEKAEQHLYLNRVSQAQREWEAGHVAMAVRLLDECQDRRRGWEWRYLRRLCRGTPATLVGHTEPVTAVAFSPDGTRIASGGWDRTVRVWDARAGLEVLRLPGFIHPVTAVAVSPDGQWIASASSSEVKLWDAANGREVRSLRGHTDTVTAVAFSPDGTRLASGGWDRTVRVWDGRTGREVLRLPGFSHPVTAVAVSPDGHWIASASASEVKLWEAAHGREVRSLRGHTDTVTAVAFSPDGARVASAGRDRTVKLWDARTGREAHHLTGHTDEVKAVAFSGDGTRLASAGGDSTITVWDTRTGRVGLTLRGHTAAVTAVAFSGDGARLASAGGDCTVKVWDTRIDPEARTFTGFTRPVTSVAFSHDGTRLASADGPNLRVWDARSGEEVLTAAGPPGQVRAVAFNAHDSRIATTGANHTLSVWAARGGAAVPLVGHTEPVTAVAFSPDTERIASVSLDRTVRVWETQTGKVANILLGHTDAVFAVAFSPNGAQLASTSASEVKLWDLKIVGELLTLKLANPILEPVPAPGREPGFVGAVAFSPDGRLIASACGSVRQPGDVTVWDVKAEQVLTLRGHRSAITAVAFSPDGTRLASAGEDQTVKVWDARTGQETLTLRGHAAGVAAVAFSLDGTRLASAGRDRTVRVWDARAAHEAVPLRDLAARMAANRNVPAVAPPPREEQIQDLNLLWRDDPAWHDEQARQAEAAQDKFAAAFHLGRLLALNPNDTAGLARRARLHAEAGNWPGAVADFAHCVELDPDRADLAPLARAQLGAGQVEKHTATVRRLANRVTRRQALAAIGVGFGCPPGNGLGLAIASRTLAGLPPTHNDVVCLAELGVVRPATLTPAELLAAADRAGPSYRGPALTRASCFDEAARSMAGWEEWPADLDSSRRRLFVALAEHGCGNRARARQAYRKSVAWLDAPSKDDPKQSNFARVVWGLRVELAVLRREVEEVLGQPREPGRMEPARDAVAPGGAKP